MWWCIKCHLPLSKQESNKEKSCIDEYLNSNDCVIGCISIESCPFKVPTEYRVDATKMNNKRKCKSNDDPHESID